MTPKHHQDPHPRPGMQDSHDKRRQIASLLNQIQKKSTESNKMPGQARYLRWRREFTARESPRKACQSQRQSRRRWESVRHQETEPKVEGQRSRRGSSGGRNPPALTPSFPPQITASRRNGSRDRNCIRNNHKKSRGEVSNNNNNNKNWDEKRELRWKMRLLSVQRPFRFSLTPPHSAFYLSFHFV